MEESRRNIRNVIIVVGALLVCLVIYFVHLHSLSAKIVVTIAPTDSKVSINGKHGRSGTNRVKPGAYTVTVSKKGFSSVSQKVSVKKGDKKTVGIALSPNSAATSNWYLKHPDDARIAEGISSNNNDKLAQQSKQNAPLIQLLPFVGGGLEFRVDYGNLPGSQSGTPVIYITAPSPQAQQDGLNWINSLGYDLSNYNIKFVTGAVQPLE